MFASAKSDNKIHPEESTVDKTNPLNPIQSPVTPAGATTTTNAWIANTAAASDDNSSSATPMRVIATHAGSGKRILQTEEYVPVRVAREKVKIILSEMAEMKARHLNVVTELEAQYNKMRSDAESKLAQIANAMKAQHAKEMKRLQNEYKDKFDSVHNSAKGAAEEELGRQRAILEHERKTFTKEKTTQEAAMRELVAAKETLDAEVANLKTLVTSLETENTQKDEQLHALKTSTSASAAAAASQTQQTIDAMKRTLELAYQQRDEAKNESSALQKQCSELQATAAGLQGQQADLAEVTQRLQSTEKEREELSARATALEAQLSEQQADLQAASVEKLDRAEVEIQRLGTECEEKTKRVVELEAMVKELEAKVVVQQQEKEQQAAQQLEEALATANDEKAKLRKELDEALAKVQQSASASNEQWQQKYNLAVRQHQQEVEMLRNEIGLGATFRGDFNAESTVMFEEHVSDPTMMRRASKVQLLEDALRKKDEELNEKTQKLQAQLDDAASRLQEAEEQRDEVLQQLAQYSANPAMQALGDKSHEIKELERRKRELEEERDREAHDAALRIAELERQVDDLQTEFVYAQHAVEKEAQEHRLKIADAERERQLIQKELHKAVDNLGAHSKEVEALQNQLDEKENEVDDMKVKATQLERRAEDLDRTHTSKIVGLEKELMERDRALLAYNKKAQRGLEENSKMLDKALDEHTALSHEATASAGENGDGAEAAEVVRKLQNNAEHVRSVNHQRAVLGVQALKLNQQKAQERSKKVKKNEAHRKALDADEQATLIASLQQSVESYQEEIGDLNITIKNLQKQCAEAQATASKESIEKEVKGAVEVVETKLSKVTHKYEKTKAELKETQSKLKEAEDGKERAENKLEVMTAKLADLETVAADVGSLRDQCLVLEKDASRAKAEAKEADTKWREEVVLRKKYFNQILDLKGKIRVMVRCRPQNKIETSKQSEIVVNFPDEYTVKIPSKDNREFLFDRSYHYDSTQDMVWEDAKYFAQSAIDGYNTCIFAYGQTGSGKTFTMEGNEENPGLTPRFIKEIFATLNSMSGSYEWKVSCYMLELYNDQLWDLLWAGGPKKERPPLDIKLDKDKNTVNVPNAVVAPAATAEELRATFVKGCGSRHTRTTGMNDSSSRSHLIFSILLETRQKSTGKVANGKLSLVDLAGSERLDKTGIKDAEGLKEAKSINKSLTALGNVINALVKDPEGHIPYRDNKLTQVMRDSLGGNAKTMMIAAISPASYNLEETVNTMVYASRAKEITNDAQKAVDSKEIAKLKEKIAALKKGLQVDDADVLLTTEEPEDDGEIDPPTPEE